MSEAEYLAAADAAVVDASAVLRWAFEDEADRAGALRLESALREGRIHAVDPHEFAGSAFRLAPRARIRVPDAAYVQVARARRAILVTADERQLAVADALGVPVVALADLPPL